MRRRRVSENKNEIRIHDGDVISFFHRDLMVTNEAGLEPETIDLDASDIAGWNADIFGKKK